MFGSDNNKNKPAPLPANPAQVAVTQAWTARIGPQAVGLQPSVNGDVITVAGTDGSVAAIDAISGRDLWRATVKGGVSAGVGSDGQRAAVVTQGNEVVVLEGGRELWRARIAAQVYTPPLVAGERVFVLSADRAVTAFDGLNGRQLWRQQRTGEPLVLRQPGVMLAVGDTLVVGLSGRLVGLNPNTGGSRWEVPVAAPRGINDVERLVDLAGPAARRGDVVCARAFQAAVGCVNADRGTLEWSKPANGFQGLAGDGATVFGTEADGRVTAWRVGDGEKAWSIDALRFRSLTAPVVVGRSVAVGDNTGLVHLLARDDGATLNRLNTDGSAILAAPVFSADTLIAVTRNGGVYGFRPE